MDLVDRLLGRGVPASSPPLRADSMDLHSRRMALQAHPTFTREDSISVHKRRQAKRLSMEDDPIAAAAAAAAAVAAAALATVEGDTSDRGAALDQRRSTEVRPQDICLQSTQRQRTDSIMLAKVRNPRISREHERPTTAPANDAGITQKFRHFIEKLTGSHNSHSHEASASSFSRQSASQKQRRSSKSEGGEREHLHRYAPPPPGTSIRPALRPATAPRPPRQPPARTGSWHQAGAGLPVRLRRSLSLDVQQPAGGVDQTRPQEPLPGAPF